MKAFLTLFGALASFIVASTGPVSAQSRNFMMNECSSAGQTYFRDFNAETEMQYNGQRVDGTHAINGRIYLETRAEDFACSYDRAGRRMVSFYAQGRSRPNPLPGGSNDSGASSGGGSDILRVSGLASNDVLNVRSGPGTGYRIIGALVNGDRVRRLRCEKNGSTTWCEIEMMTDMRERGWVSARYLSGGGSATNLPSPPPATNPGQGSAIVVRFPPGATGTEMTERLSAGTARRYLLGARNRQFLYFEIAANSPNLTWRIFNPDGSLLDQGPAARAYRGQLWQSGDHVVEVTNQSGRSQTFNLIFGIN